MNGFISVLVQLHTWNKVFNASTIQLTSQLPLNVSHITLLGNTNLDESVVSFSHLLERCLSLESTPIHFFPSSQSQSYVSTDGQPTSLSWNKAPTWGLRPDIYYLCDSYGLVLVGRPLWREVGSVFCKHCWSLPVQSFSGPSPLGFETIFYCLRFQTSLFVAS
jgi:hypothetical protein